MHAAHTWHKNIMVGLCSHTDWMLALVVATIVWLLPYVPHPHAHRHSHVFECGWISICCWLSMVRVTSCFFFFLLFIVYNCVSPTMCCMMLYENMYFFFLNRSTALWFVRVLTGSIGGIAFCCGSRNKAFLSVTIAKIRMHINSIQVRIKYCSSKWLYRCIYDIEVGISIVYMCR